MIDFRLSPYKLLLVSSLSLLVTACGGEGSTAPDSNQPTVPDDKTTPKNPPTSDPGDQETAESVYINDSYKPLLVTSKSGSFIPFENLKVSDGTLSDIIKLTDQAIGIKLPQSAQGQHSIELTDSADNTAYRYSFTVKDPQQTIIKAQKSTKLLSQGFKKANEFIYTQPILAHKSKVSNFDSSIEIPFTAINYDYCQALVDDTGKLILTLPTNENVKYISEQVQSSPVDSFSQYSFLYKDSSDQVKVYTPNANSGTSPTTDGTYYVSCVVNLPVDIDYNALATELTKAFAVQKTQTITQIIKEQYILSGKGDQQATEKAAENTDKYVNKYKAQLFEQLLLQLPSSQSNNMTHQELAEHLSEQLLTTSIIDDLQYQIEVEKLEENLDRLQELEEVEKLVEKPVDTASKISAFIQAQARRDWFLAEKELSKYEPIYQHDIELIQQAPYRAELKQPSIDFINKKYNDAKYYLEVSKSRANSHLYGLYNKITAEYSNVCEANINTQGINCDLLNSILGLDKDTIYAMNLDEQRILYNTLQRVTNSAK